MQLRQSMQEIINKGITNPSGVVMCLYGRGFTGKFMELRKYVQKELDRLSKLTA